MPIKREWFQLIVADVKKEEYRSDSDYWRARLLNKPKLRTVRLINGRDPNKHPHVVCELLRVSVIPVSEVKEGWAPPVGTKEHKETFQDATHVICLHLGKILEFPSDAKIQPSFDAVASPQEDSKPVQAAGRNDVTPERRTSRGISAVITSPAPTVIDESENETPCRESCKDARESELPAKHGFDTEMKKLIHKNLSPLPEASEVSDDSETEDVDDEEEASLSTDVSGMTVQQLTFCYNLVRRIGLPADLEDIFNRREERSELYVRHPWLSVIEAGLKFGTWRTAFQKSAEFLRGRFDAMDINEADLHGALAATALLKAKSPGSDADWVSHDQYK